MKLTQRLERPNAEIAFADQGPEGPAVVLTHGAGLDYTMFDEQVVALTASGYRTIVWDMRGHGESTLASGARFAAADALDDLTAILDDRQLDHPILIGHSLGGNLTQAFVRAHQDRVGGHIIMDSTWNAGPLTSVERLAVRLVAPALTLIPKHALPGQMARASAVSPHAIARAEAAFAQMPKRTFLDVWLAAESFVAPEADYRTCVPLALVRGENDHTGNIAAAMSRWAHATGVGEHVIPDAGHIPTWDAPESTSHALLEILDSWGYDKASSPRGEA